MRREEIRAYIKSGVDALSPAISFNSGRITEFNSERSNEYPYVWLESLSSSPDVADSGASYDLWAIVLHVAKKDDIDSKPEQYEAIIDECDYIAQQLWSQYNTILSTSNKLILSGGVREPFIHKHADDTTGVILSFTIQDFSPVPICV
jgi:hypothetical protein